MLAEAYGITRIVIACGHTDLRLGIEVLFHDFLCCLATFFILAR